MRLYLKFMQIAIRARMEYRSDTLVGFVSSIVFNCLNLGLIGIVLQRFHSLGGWVFGEVVMLYGMWLLSHTVFVTFFQQILFLENIILQGNFDQYLLRPASPFLQFISREVNYLGVGDFVLAVVLLSAAYRELGLSWSASKFLLFASAILSGAAIEVSINILIASISFWNGRSSNLSSIIMNFYFLTQQYPLDMFGRSYQLFLTTFLPIAFINYYPLSQLLDKENGLGIPLLGFLSPIVAIVMVSLTAFVWRRGLLNYASSGN